MTEIRKQRLTVLIPVLVCVVSIIGITVFWQYEYRQTAFEHVSKPVSYTHLTLPTKA